MIFPVKMKKLTVVLLREYSDDIARCLLELGCIDFIANPELQLYRDQDVSNSEELLRELIERVEIFLGMISRKEELPQTLSISDLQEIETDKYKKNLDRLAGALQKLRDGQRKIQEKILQLEEIQRQVEQLSDGIILSGSTGLLDIYIGRIPAVDFDSFSQVVSRTTSFLSETGNEEESSFFVLLTMNRERLSVEKILKQFNYISSDFPASIDCNRIYLIEKVTGTLDSFREKQDFLNSDINRTIESKLDILVGMWTDLSVNLLFIKVRSCFYYTENTSIFSGWIPVKEVEKVESVLKDVSDDSYFLKLTSPGSTLSEDLRSEIPVKLSQPSVFKPFQMIVENYSVPAYGTIDPTIFTAISYLLMFGLMFGDAGHGIVLSLTGLAGMVFIKGRYLKIFMLMIWCGLSALLFGILFGSYFGMGWFKPLWFDYHGIISGEIHNISLVNTLFDVLGITVYFGIAIIYLGLILNWINLFIRKQWILLFLDKKGVLGGWLYGAGIYSVKIFVQSDYKHLPSMEVLLAIIIFPVFLLFLKAPLESRGKMKKQGRISGFLMDGIVETLEVFTGYLSNTLSFMRIAGIGIAHISLMIAFFQISESVDSRILSIIILVLGNALVIALEGLSAGIQSLRLNYYEFYSKYFRGKGQAFIPVSLNLKINRGAV